MREYLSRSMSSVNRNKVNGMLAEIEFRRHIQSLGYGDHVSVGGWVARSQRIAGVSEFGQKVVAIFPETVMPGNEYPPGMRMPDPPTGLHTICATFHQMGIHGYYCVPTFGEDGSPSSVVWNAAQLGIPSVTEYRRFPECIDGFESRLRRYNYLRYHADVSGLPDEHVPEEFTKELLRVSFSNRYFAEVSDIDGILWGKQYTYPIEIKEKTAADDRTMGEFFGIDAGPFVKLAFYAAKKGNLHSIFVVREIEDVESRKLICWRYITFEVLAQYAGWTPMSGGTNMLGGASHVIKIPKSRFSVLDTRALQSL